MILLRALFPDNRAFMHALARHIQFRHKEIMIFHRIIISKHSLKKTLEVYFIQ